MIEEQKSSSDDVEMTAAESNAASEPIKVQKQDG